MRLFLLLLCLPLLAIMPATAQPELLPGILGDDNRVPTESLDWPWAAVGRVNRASGGFCTGTLIGPHHVLTAAHCLFDRGGRRIVPSDIHFVAGYQRGNYLAHSVARALVVPQGYRPDAAMRVDVLAEDWAVVVLREPIDIRPVPVWAVDRVPSAGDRLVRAGYGRDRAHLLSVHEGCGIAGRSGGDRLLLHSCDATRGDSGSPLLRRTEKGIGLVGIDVGVVRSGGADHGVAVSAAGFGAALQAILAASPAAAKH
jgi:protease YdgD